MAKETAVGTRAIIIGPIMQAKKKRSKALGDLFLQFGLFFSFPSHPRLTILGGSLHILFNRVLIVFTRLGSFCTTTKMSAVQPVAVYALRVPPGAMVPAVPNAAASVSNIYLEA